MAFSITAFSQSKNVPAVVKTAFSKKFPAAKNVKWTNESKTEWEAEFTLKDKEMSASFDPKGNWKETETNLRVTNLSATVLKTLHSKFRGYTVKSVAYTVNPKYKAYEIDIAKGESKLEVTIDKTGKLLKKENASEDND